MATGGGGGTIAGTDGAGTVGAGAGGIAADADSGGSAGSGGIGAFVTGGGGGANFGKSGAAGGAFGRLAVATGGSGGSGIVPFAVCAGCSILGVGPDGCGGVTPGASGTATVGGVIFGGKTDGAGFGDGAGVGNDRATDVVEPVARLVGGVIFGAGAAGARVICGRAIGVGRGATGCRAPGSITRDLGMTAGGGNSCPALGVVDADAVAGIPRGAG